MDSPLSLLTQTVSLYRNNFILFLKIIIRSFLYIVITIALTGFILALLTFVNTNAAVLGVGFATTIIIAVITVAFIQSWTMLALAWATKQTLSKSGASQMESFAHTRQFVIPLWIAGLLTSIFLLGGYFLFIIPGIVISIWFSFTTFTVLFEEERGFSALRASMSLVRGKFFYVFVNTIVVSIFITLILYGPTMLLNGDSYSLLSGIYSAVAGILVMPIGPIFGYLQYKALKKNEGTNKSSLFIPFIFSVLGYILIIILGTAIIAIIGTFFSNMRIQPAPQTTQTEFS